MSKKLINAAKVQPPGFLIWFVLLKCIFIYINCIWSWDKWWQHLMIQKPLVSSSGCFLLVQQVTIQYVLCNCCFVCCCCQNPQTCQHMLFNSIISIMLQQYKKHLKATVFSSFGGKKHFTEGVQNEMWSACFRIN